MIPPSATNILRRLRTAAAFIAALSPLVAFAENSPTLTSTTAWLQTHLPKSTFAADENNTAGYSLKYQFDSCKLEIAYDSFETEFGKGAGGQRLVAIQLEPLPGRSFSFTPVVLGDSGDLRTHYYSDRIGVDLGDVRLSSIAKEVLVVGGSSGNPVKALDITKLTPERIRLPVAESDLADRLVRSMRQAVSLCSTKH